jgi:hypothetical protein
MVWTGSEAMIWGGDKPDGGRYCAYATCEVRTWYRDADRDGYGRSTDTVAACDQPPSYGALPGDCNDVNTAVHPGAIEACDGNDDNCDGTIDENGAALCDDGDLCTDDLCGGVTGCVHVNNTAPCSDGNACTLGDACSAGICSPGRAVNPKLDCDDHNACTRDYCDEGAGCMNAPIICRDGNPSTLDSCDPRRGCVFTPRHGRQVTAGAHGQVEAEGD